MQTFPKDVVDVLHSKITFLGGFSETPVPLPIYLTFRRIRQQSVMYATITLNFSFLHCFVVSVSSKTVQCIELLLPCLGVSADVLCQTLITGGVHITVCNNVWKSGLAAPKWGVY
jgi:hypothetical protein